MTLSKSLTDAIAGAADVLDEQALYRLSEILVEEVSVVDRAANKRKFITIKRDQGDDGMTTKGLSLTSEAKSAVSGLLTGALSDLVKLSKTIEEASESEEGVSQLPAELMAELKSATGALGKLLVSQTAKGVGTVAESLVQIAEMSLMLAEEVATSGEVDSEASARMGQMAKLLDTLTAKGDADDKSDDAPTVDGDAAKGDDADDESDDAPAADDKSDDAPAVDDTDKSDDKMAQVVAALAALTENVTTLTATVAEQTKAAPEPTVEPKADEVAKQLASLEKSNKELRAKLTKAEEEPPEGASSTSPVTKNAEGRRVFPQSYNHPIHDPASQA